VNLYIQERERKRRYFSKRRKTGVQEKILGVRNWCVRKERWTLFYYRGRKKIKFKYRGGEHSLVIRGKGEGGG